jgi:hypothetical protein
MAVLKNTAGENWPNVLAGGVERVASNGDRCGSRAGQV